MRTRTTALAASGVAAVVAALTATTVLTGSASAASGPDDAIGLGADGRTLLSVDVDAPATARSIGTVTGLRDDTRLVGIDYRVQDGRLYGVGDRGGIYQVSDTTAAATKVQQLAQALEGDRFGVDFNPAANALRIVSDRGQNLRQPFAGSAAGVTQVDGRLNTPVEARGITGAAYTNNDLDATTATTLFDLDTTLDQVVLQSPANSGSVVATGNLGVDAGPDAGFDIVTTTSGGRAVDNAAVAVLTVGGRTGAYRVSLLTGSVQLTGQFATPVSDIALRLQR